MAKGARILKKGFESVSLSEDGTIDSIDFLEDDNGPTDAFFGGAEPNIQWIQWFQEMGWGNDLSFATTGETITTAEEPPQTTEPNEAPVVEITRLFAPTGTMSPVGKWVSYSDAEGDAAVQYQFRDDGAARNSAYLVTPDNARHPAGTVVTVAPEDLNGVRVHSGAPGTKDTIWVRAFDGTDWSDWEPIYFATTNWYISYGAGITAMFMPTNFAGEDTLVGRTTTIASDLTENAIQVDSAPPSIFTGGLSVGNGTGTIYNTTIAHHVTPVITATASHDGDALLV